MIYCATKRNKIVENAIDIKLIYCMHFAMIALRGLENHENFMSESLTRSLFLLRIMTSFLSSSLKLALKSMAPSVFAFIRNKNSAGCWRVAFEKKSQTFLSKNQNLSCYKKFLHPQ